MNPSGALVVALLFGIPGISAGQSQPAATPATFDVASIKPNPAGGEARRAGATPGGTFTASNVPLRLLISRAYGVPEDQIEGGPGWIATDTWDIIAKADTPLEMTREQLRPCLQALLADRFQLKVHHATKQGAVLSLIVAKGGAKLKEHTGGGLSGISASSGSGEISITGTKTTLATLAEYLAAQAGRPVIDSTGLQREYDFQVTWAADDAGPSGPSLFAALEDQLGLRLSAAKGPIELIVVDRAEKASAS